MQIKVKFFASYKILTGVDRDDLEVPEGTNASEFLKILAGKYKNSNIDRDETLLVVNEKIALRDHVLQDGDEMMIFHHFAGG